MTTLKWSKAAVFAILLIFYGSLITFKIPLPAAEDLPRQMQNGKDILQGHFDVLSKNVYSYTEPDHHFNNSHWLYGIVAYLLHQAVGWGGMVVFKVLFILLTFALLFSIALRRADFWLVALCSIPMIVMLTDRASLRPELFNYFFIVLYVYALFHLEEHPKSNWVYGLIPLQVVWANMHISYPIGIMIVGGFLLEKIVLNYKELWRNALVRKLAAVAVALVAVSFINPNGIQAIPSLVLDTSKDFPVVSSENRAIFAISDEIPKDANIAINLFLPMLLVASVSFIVGYRKKPIFYFLAYVSTAALSLLILRSLPFFAIFFLLAVSSNFNDLFLRIKKWVEGNWPIKAVGPGATFVALFTAGLIGFSLLSYQPLMADREPGIGLSRDAGAAAQFFLENNLKGPTLNDTDIGSYLIWYLYPQERIYSDNRFADAYSASFFKDDYVAPLTDEHAWKGVAAKYQFNTIFFYQYDQNSDIRDFIFRRINDGEWSLVYADRFSVILVKNTPANEDVINKFGITPANAQARFSALTASSDPEDQVAAGDIFALMGQTDWALSSYVRAVAQRPDWGKIWFIMGRVELKRPDQSNADPALGLSYVQRAIDAGWKTPNAYSFLALAYYRLNQLDKAETAARQELKLDPNYTDAKNWLDEIAKARTAALPQQ